MSNFKTMLAGKVTEPENLRYPVLASPKLDGIRFHVLNGTVVSRNLRPFPNPVIQDTWGGKQNEGNDGEFIMGDPTAPDAFRKMTVQVIHVASVDNLYGHLFDNFNKPQMYFNDRLIVVAHRALQRVAVRKVDHRLIHNVEALLEYERTKVEEGYEGIMVRDPMGPYKFGRSTEREGWLLKLKQFEDGEAVIQGFEERMHNANEKTLERSGKAQRNSKKEGMVPTGTLGALIVQERNTGVTFNIGTGFDDAERQDIWDNRPDWIGKIVKYKFFKGGSKTKPRFPSYHGLRYEADL